VGLAPPLFLTVGPCSGVNFFFELFINPSGDIYQFKRAEFLRGRDDFLYIFVQECKAGSCGDKNA